MSAAASYTAFAVFPLPSPFCAPAIPLLWLFSSTWSWEQSRAEHAQEQAVKKTAGINNALAKCFQYLISLQALRGFVPPLQQTRAKKVMFMNLELADRALASTTDYICVMNLEFADWALANATNYTSHCCVWRTKTRRKKLSEKIKTGRKCHFRLIAQVFQNLTSCTLERLNLEVQKRKPYSITYKPRNQAGSWAICPPPQESESGALVQSQRRKSPCCLNFAAFLLNSCECRPHPTSPFVAADTGIPTCLTVSLSRMAFVSSTNSLTPHFLCSALVNPTLAGYSLGESTRPSWRPRAAACAAWSCSTCCWSLRASPRRSTTPTRWPSPSSSSRASAPASCRPATACHGAATRASGTVPSTM
jgi:hypothetical protein